MKINQLISLLTLSFAVASQSFGCNKQDIQITSLPFEAKRNATYCLPNDLIYDARTLGRGKTIPFIVPSYAAIKVTAANVKINLNGKTLTATNLLPDKGAIAIFSSSASSITVANGTVSGFDIGVVAHAKRESNVTKVRVTKGKLAGIYSKADLVDISYNEVSSINSRWKVYMSGIDIEKSKIAKVYNNTIKNIRAKDTNPSPDIIKFFYGAHGISAYEFGSLDIFNNSLSDLATEDALFSYISLLGFNNNVNGIVSIYGNKFVYPIEYAASVKENLGFHMLDKNNVSLYNNEFTGFLRNVIFASNTSPNGMTYFNNIFHRYIYKKKYEPLFPEGSAIPVDNGGNQFIYH